MNGEQAEPACAIVTRPSVLFADEPTGNLDTHTSQGESLLSQKAAA